MSKLIALTQGQFAKVDDDDFDKFNALSWYADWSENVQGFYAKHTGPRPESKKIYLHRAIMGHPVGKLVDHQNGDTLDCRKENLRVCTRAENCRNRTSLDKNNTSGSRGVCWDKSRGRWMAKIEVKGKSIYLGRFKSKSDASAAYVAANRKYFGDFGGVTVGE